MIGTRTLHVAHLYWGADSPICRIISSAFVPVFDAFWLQESKKPPNKKKNNSSNSLSSLNSSDSLKDLQNQNNNSGAAETNDTGASGTNTDLKPSEESW